ncbi:MAG: zinc-ribbon domain-containing protein [Clostridia bacterium]|nr:zinc-ribbon domain-containing protein [Clostridia bacterium]
MRCNQCGADNSDDSIFCMNCGTSLSGSANVEVQSSVPDTDNSNTEVNSEAEVNPEYTNNDSVTDYGVESNVETVENTEETAENKKKIKLMPFIIGGAAVAVIIILIVVLVSIFGGKYVEVDTSIVLYNCDGEIVICNNGEKLSKTIEGSYSSKQSNLKGDVVAFLVQKESDESDASDDSYYSSYYSDYMSNATYDLYCVEDDEVKEIANDVKKYELSAEGNAIAFLDSEGGLCSVEVGSGKKVTVEDEVSDYAISPDGSDIVYIIKDSDDSTATVYLYDGSDKTKIGSNFEINTSVLALSDGGDLIYLLAEKDGKSALYVYTDGGEGKTKLCDSSVTSAYLNYDHTQLMYAYDGKTYISVDGKDGVKVSSVELTPVVPANVGVSSGSCGIKDFFENVFTGEGNIYYLDKKGESGKLASDTTNRRISEDGDSVYYIEDDDLYVVDAKMNAEPEKLLTDVSSFEITPDGDKIYFQKDEDLYCYLGGTKVKQIKIDVSSFDVSSEGLCFFVCDDDELYVSKNGKSSDKISSDVINFYCYSNSVLYETLSDGTICIYGSDGDAKFSLITKYETEE